MDLVVDWVRETAVAGRIIPLEGGGALVVGRRQFGRPDCWRPTIVQVDRDGDIDNTLQLERLCESSGPDACLNDATRLTVMSSSAEPRYSIDSVLNGQTELRRTSNAGDGGSGLVFDRDCALYEVHRDRAPAVWLRSREDLHDVPMPSHASRIHWARGSWLTLGLRPDVGESMWPVASVAPSGALQWDVALPMSGLAALEFGCAPRDKAAVLASVEFRSLTPGDYQVSEWRIGADGSIGGPHALWDDVIDVPVYAPLDDGSFLRAVMVDDAVPPVLARELVVSRVRADGSEAAVYRLGYSDGVFAPSAMAVLSDGAVLLSGTVSGALSIEGFPVVAPEAQSVLIKLIGQR